MTLLIETEIICNNFEQKVIEDDKIMVDEKSEEYYVIPLNKSYDMESDDKVFKLSFKNQLLLLEYSNRFGIINLKEHGFKECVLIKSADILDIYVKIHTSRYMRKNVWQSRYNLSMNKQYLGKYFIAIPIIDDMINIVKHDTGIGYYDIEVISNEILLRQVVSRNNGHGTLSITNNFMLNKDALFIELYDGDLDLFLEH